MLLTWEENHLLTEAIREQLKQGTGIRHWGENGKRQGELPTTKTNGFISY
jgi:hypothetical protein